ncbi:MAG: hypothetical protein IAF38_20420, partial [Bacteroidia bacterium]|nr:hypothetical protein [Bacteroidia bacterium]
MKKIAFIFLLIPFLGWNQTGYEAYGQQGADVYHDLKTALKDAEGV